MNCPVCRKSDLKPYRAGVSRDKLSADNFKITDSSYGETLSLWRCVSCGYIFASETNLTDFYCELEDEEYYATWDSRRLQMEKLLKKIKQWQPKGKLLDIGAGCGIMLDVAQSAGYESVGIEPSSWLVSKARERGLTVFEGVLPHPKLPMHDFDVVCLIDIIEHVNKPVDLLREVWGRLTPDGIGILVTPNVSSLASRIMGRRWWHFRIAHVGYFNRDNLKLALEEAGLEIITVMSSPWYFPLSYLLTRGLKYLPKVLRFTPPEFCKRIILPLNLYDSITVFFKRRPTDNLSDGLA